MKKIIVLFVAIATTGFTLTSCSKDDDGGINQANLIGKWEYSKEGEVIDGQELLIDYDHSPGCAKDYNEFLSNGTLRDVGYYSNGVNPCVEDIFNSTWSVSGNNIITTVLGVTYTAEVVTLNATTLKMKYVDEDGTYITVYTKAN